MQGIALAGYIFVFVTHCFSTPLQSRPQRYAEKYSDALFSDCITLISALVSIPMNTLDTLKNPTQKWEWIKFQLRTKGTSLAALAKGLGVSRNAMNNVKRLPYPRMEREIARVLELQPATLWPDRWNANGTPKRQRPMRAESRINTVTPTGKDTPVRGGSHCQSVEGV